MKPLARASAIWPAPMKPIFWLSSTPICIRQHQSETDRGRLETRQDRRNLWQHGMTGRATKPRRGHQTGKDRNLDPTTTSRGTMPRPEDGTSSPRSKERQRKWVVGTAAAGSRYLEGLRSGSGGGVRRNVSAAASRIAEQLGNVKATKSATRQVS